MFLPGDGCQIGLQLQQVFQHSLASLSLSCLGRKTSEESKIHTCGIALKLTALLEQFAI